MKRLTRTIRVLLILFPTILLSCFPEDEPYFEGKLPTNPINLAPFNTEFDDYNSTAPTVGSLIPFCFSTNRNTSGGNFDIIYQPMTVSFETISGILTITNSYSHWGVYQPSFDVIKDAVDIINTTANEFGPYLIMNPELKNTFNEFLLLYATDVSGNFQINYTHNVNLTSFIDGAPITGLNSENNDLYPCFNQDFSGIYFSSDREDGVFNFYYTPIDNTDDGLIAAIESLENNEITKVDVLSSEYDDKCPYILGNTMVFASNRPGGEGGYDLYYSNFEDGQWSAPINFGATFNSTSDEFRPIIIEERVDDNRHMMIFSSNRSGGKGGFDLYFVGIDK